MAGVVGHTGGLTNPRPWRGRCRAGYSNTGGPPLPRKRAPLTKKKFSKLSIKNTPKKNPLFTMVPRSTFPRSEPNNFFLRTGINF